MDGDLIAGVGGNDHQRQHRVRGNLDGIKDKNGAIRYEALESVSEFNLTADLMFVTVREFRADGSKMIKGARRVTIDHR